MSHLTEQERSLQRRGFLGHYLAGAYRTLMRPAFTQWHIARAKTKAFLWGMDEVSQYVYGRSRRDMPALLRAFGATVADDAIVMERLNIHNANHARYENLHIGKKALIANDVFMDLAVGVTLEDCALIGPHCRLLGHTDFGSSPLKQRYPATIGAIHIKHGAFVGTQSVVMYGVTIGECAVVAAGSLVREDVPPYTLVAGNPLKVIREIDRSG